MSKKGIDVSSYQGAIDWDQSRRDGVDFAILKIIRKDLNPDKQFEVNCRGCYDAGVDLVGAYNYSYATTTEKAVQDAKKVIDILNGRKLTVWMDIEDSCQKGLGSGLIEIINAYKEVIESETEFGIYTGLSFYNSYIKPYSSQINCPFWIARYPSGSQLKVSVDPNIKYQPAIQHSLFGWQYSSKGTVAGIKGSVDLNVWYEEITEVIENTSVVCPYQEPERTLYKRALMMHGDDVKWLQWHLVRLGFMQAVIDGKDSVDGWLWTETDKAIERAQRSFGIKADKKAGAVTRAYLKSH